MRYFILLLLPFILFSKPLKIATYNVENLFDATSQGTEYDQYMPGKHNWTKQMVDTKLNHTAKVICDLDADILGLQEVENSNIFQELISRLDEVGCSYKYSAITEKKGEAIQVALLSRYPLHKQKDLQVSYTVGVRNILEAEVDIGGKSLTFFVNHWKSKAYKGFESKRIKYAKILQGRIMRMPKNKEYIIMGDFNSDYNAYLTLEDKLNDTQGKTAFSEVLQTKTGTGLVQKGAMPKASRGIHYTLWQELPFNERWSHNFYGKKSTIDQIVLPQNMFDGEGIDYVNNSFKVFKASFLFTKEGYINRWQYKNGKHTGKGYSDHLPVYAWFDDLPYKADLQKKCVPKREKKEIDYLYGIESLNSEVILENAVVVLKRGRNAIIKQHPEGRGIYLYGGADKLQEGHAYDFLVQAITNYHGLKEITHVYKLKSKGAVKLDSFYDKTKYTRQNEVLHNFIGIYKDKKIQLDGREIDIYFKKKTNIPPNGSKLKIHYAHLGYYKKLQVVIYDNKDFEIVE